MDQNGPKKEFMKLLNTNKNLDLESFEGRANACLYFECKSFLPGLLVVGDKLAMSCPFEERFPFLDNDLVDYAQTIPFEWKVKDFTKASANSGRHAEGKFILRSAMEELLPRSALDREKQGFSSPDENWFRRGNRKFVESMLLNPNLACAEFLQASYVRRVVEEHMSETKNHRLLIWSLLCFEVWCLIFLREENVEKLTESFLNMET